VAQRHPSTLVEGVDNLRLDNSRSHLQSGPVSRSRQRGVVLFIGLIMLIVMTLLAVSGIRTSTTNLKVVGNMQAQAEAINAAQQAIDNVMASVNNFYTPIAGTFTVDVNNDGVPDYTVVVPAPNCLRMSAVEGYSAEFAPFAPKETYWNVQATATDTRTGVSVTVSQGVRVRLASSASCPP